MYLQVTPFAYIFDKYKNYVNRRFGFSTKAISSFIKCNYVSIYIKNGKPADGSVETENLKVSGD